MHSVPILIPKDIKRCGPEHCQVVVNSVPEAKVFTGALRDILKRYEYPSGANGRRGLRNFAYHLVYLTEKSSRRHVSSGLN